MTEKEIMDAISFINAHKDREDIKDNIKNYLYNYISEHFSNVTNTQLIIGEKR